MSQVGAAAREVPLVRGLGAAGLLLLATFALTYGPALGGLIKSPAELLAVRLTSSLLLLVLVRALVVPQLGIALESLGLGLNGRTFSRFFVGLVQGFAALTLAFCVAWGAGAFTALPNEAEQSLSGLGFDLGLYFFSALFEELAFRVGLIGILRTVLRPALAVGVSAAVFGLLHATNPGASTLAVLNTTLAGLLLGLLFLERRGEPSVPSLGLCTGFHVAWNATQSCLFGVPVSGYMARWRALTVEPHDIDWSGGSYGLEGGYAATVALLACTAWAYHRAELRTPKILA